MATFVLVPGAWLGGWAWQDVARDLRQRGHTVYPVTLTGVGERVHLGNAEIDLETHITDVVNLTVYEDLVEVILVGHSYAGIVVTGVADRVPARLSQLVFLDAAPFQNGQALLDVLPPEAKAATQRVVDDVGEGWKLPFPPFEELGPESSLAGLGKTERELMKARATPQPFATYRQPLRLTSSEPASYRRAAIICNEMRGLIAAGVPPIVAMTEPPWRNEELETGHWAMFSAPSDLAVLLDRIATDTR
jgi:pimeloyl-ACP methyl ester carboxylesterase